MKRLLSTVLLFIFLIPITVHATPPGGGYSVKIAENQSTGNAHLAIIAGDTTSIDDKIGEVQASPTSNTILDRLKRIETELQNITVVNSANSTTTPLLGTASTPADIFTGTAIDLTPYASGMISVFTDQNSATDGLAIEYSSDGTNWDHADGHVYSITANEGRGIEFGVEAKYVRIVYTNGAVAQGTFRMQTILSKKPVSLHVHAIEYEIDGSHPAPIGRSILTGQKASGPFVNIKVDESGRLTVNAKSYLFAIAEGDVLDHTGLNKFGRNTTVGATEEEIWEYSEAYEYLDDDVFSVMYISSDNGADQGIEYVVEGIDSEYNAATATISTDGSDGNTFVAIDSGSSGGSANQWWRIFRVYCTEAQTNPKDTCAAGTIYISKDNTDIGGNGIPDTTADIQAIVLTDKRQTNMAMWTVSAGEVLFITDYYVSNGLTNKVTKVDLYVRPFGGVFRGKKPISVDSGYSLVPYEVPLVVTGKSDIVVRASTAGAGGDISAGFSGWYE